MGSKPNFFNALMTLLAGKGLNRWFNLYAPAIIQDEP